MFLSCRTDRRVHVPDRLPVQDYLAHRRVPNRSSASVGSDLPLQPWAPAFSDSSRVPRPRPAPEPTFFRPKSDSATPDDPQSRYISDITFPIREEHDMSTASIPVGQVQAAAPNPLGRVALIIGSAGLLISCLWTIIQLSYLNLVVARQGAETVARLHSTVSFDDLRGDLGPRPCLDHRGHQSDSTRRAVEGGGRYGHRHERLSARGLLGPADCQSRLGAPAALAGWR